MLPEGIRIYSEFQYLQNRYFHAVYYCFTIIFVINFVGREELLTAHAMHWNRNKVERLPHSLAKRYMTVTAIHTINLKTHLSRKL